jgi:hypothetical protein
VGIIGNAGAGSAAKEIREFVEGLEKHVTDPEAFWVIAQVIEKAESIESLCDSGWY